jgi:hypothetical protein
MWGVTSCKFELVEARAAWTDCFALALGLQFADGNKQLQWYQSHLEVEEQYALHFKMQSINYIVPIPIQVCKTKSKNHA